MKLKSKAFTLVEVMIALMILSITLTALTGGQVMSLNTSQKSRFVTIATSLARDMMEDIDINSSIQGFSYVKELGEKSEGSFEEEEYKGWKWKREVKEVNIPISKIMNTFMSSGDMQQEAENVGAAQGDQQFLGLMASNVERVMKDSLREVSVTVSWPVKAGTQYSSVVLVYYMVDFNAVRNFVPGL